MILGNRGGDLAHLKYNGLARRPVETIVGGDGLVVESGLPVPRKDLPLAAHPRAAPAGRLPAVD